jgi:hypothetical protein
VWGGGVFNVIAHSARHDDEGVAMVYFKDAEAIKLLADDRPNPLNKVPQWKQIRIVQGQNAELVRGDQETDVTLLEIASRFMRYMKLHNLPPGSNTIEQITSAAYRFGKDRLPVAGLMQEFNSAVLNLRLSERRSKKVKKNFEALIEGLLNSENDSDDDTPGPSGRRKRSRPLTIDVTIVSEDRTKRTAIKQSIDLTNRKSLSYITDPMKKLNAFLKLHREGSDKGPKNLNGSAKKLYYCTLTPIYKCLTMHFVSNKERFLEKWDILNAPIYDFNKKCCNGNGSTCGLTQTAPSISTPTETNSIAASDADGSIMEPMSLLHFM